MRRMAVPGESPSFADASILAFGQLISFIAIPRCPNGARGKRLVPYFEEKNVVFGAIAKTSER